MYIFFLPHEQASLNVGLLGIAIASTEVKIKKALKGS